MNDVPPPLPEEEIAKQESAIGEFNEIFQSLWNQQGTATIGDEFAFHAQGLIHTFTVFERKQIRFQILSHKPLFTIMLPNGTNMDNKTYRGDGAFTTAVLLALQHIKRAKQFHERRNVAQVDEIRDRVLAALAMPAGDIDKPLFEHRV